jgi:hypothetical protein
MTAVSTMNATAIASAAAATSVTTAAVKLW